MLHSDGALVVDVLSDMISNSLITGRDVDAERAVILDEIAMHGDDPAELVSELVTAQMLSGVGLGRPVIGSPGIHRGDVAVADRPALAPALPAGVPGGRGRGSS